MGKRDSGGSAVRLEAVLSPVPEDTEISFADAAIQWEWLDLETAPTTLGTKYRCPVSARSQASNQTHRDEENLLTARDTLEDLRQSQIPTELATRHKLDGWQAWLMFLLRPVAAHYGVDKDALYASWSRQYLPGIAFEGLSRMGMPGEGEPV